MVKEANRPYPGIATQTMQDAMFPHFIRQRMQEASLLPETAQVKIRNGLKNLARDRGYSGIFEAQLADSPEYLLNLKQIGR